VVIELLALASWPCSERSPAVVVRLGVAGLVGQVLLDRLARHFQPPLSLAVGKVLLDRARYSQALFAKA
jgi:hypothetical protein